MQVVIDEFQRMISDNLDIVFQQARGLEIAMVIANQSIGDLRNVGPVLLSAIEGNCAIRQWLSVTTKVDIEHLEKLFGTYKKIQETTTESTKGSSISRTPRDEPRITVSGLHQVSNDPSLSVTQIRGERGGFAQYRGCALCRSQFLSYQPRRVCASSWISVARRLARHAPVNELPVPPTPTVTKQGTSRSKPNREEGTATSKQDQKDMDDLFVPTIEVKP